MHALETIANQGLEPVTTPVSLAVGLPTNAQTLYEQFSDPSEGSSKVKCIVKMLDLTTVEFNATLKQAVVIAAHADAKAGWKASSTATGADKYGPKQKSMAVQVSNIRKVFGACKQFGTLWEFEGIDYDLESMGITAATKIAAKALRAQGVNWDGSKKPTEDQKSNARKSEQFVAAFAAVQCLPEAKGLSMAEIASSDLLEKEIQRLEALAASDAADKMVERWSKTEDSRVLIIAAVRFIAAMATDEERQAAIEAIEGSMNY